MPDTEPIILIVDDDPVYRRLVKKLVETSVRHSQVLDAAGGDQAFEMLKEADIPHKGLPVVVLLDVFMPIMSGFDFLDRLRMDPELRNSVVFMVSTSGAEEDIKSAYDRQVAGYFKKSGGLSGVRAQVDFLDEYLQTVSFQ